jgi:hypothetical protein
MVFLGGKTWRHDGAITVASSCGILGVMTISYFLTI